jgi:uncharacterized protein
MMTFVLALVIFMLIMAVMAVGVMFGRPPIKGSCGGLGAIGIDQECEICGGNPQRCESNVTLEPGREYDPGVPRH